MCVVDQDEMGNLVKLEVLGLSGNHLSSLPNTLWDLVKSRDLYIWDNHLTVLSEKIGNLVNLEKLYLDGNGLTSLPDTFGNLVGLGVLDLGDNQFVSLPPDIRKLVKLDTLDLDNNEIESLPDEIGDMKSLNQLVLSGNGLTRLPKTIENLRSTLVFLDLSGNNISESDGEGTIGRTTLVEVFGSRVRFSNATIRSGEYKITVRRVYEELKEKRMSWNIGVLRTLRPKHIPESEYSESKLIEIWESVSTGIGDIAYEDKVIRNYIHHIYKPSRKYGGWRVPYYTGLAKRLLGGIFDELSKVSDEQVVIAKVNELCEGLDRSLDNQIPGMMFLYHVLTKDAKEDGLEEFVRWVIRWEKERVFDLTVAPLLHGSQGGAILDFWMDVLTWWKYELRDEVGFDFDFKTNIVGVDGIRIMDRFHLWRGNFLRMFYKKFTPEHMIEVLKEQINGNNDMKNSAMLLVVYDYKVPNEKKVEILEWDEVPDVSGLSKEDFEDMAIERAKGVTEVFCTHYLVGMGVVIVRE